jgi:hypothetical protein
MLWKWIKIEVQGDQDTAISENRIARLSVATYSRTKSLTDSIMIEYHRGSSEPVNA